MHFAYPLPWWLAVVVAAAIAAIAFLEYRRPLAPLTTAQRAVLMALRVVALAAILIFLWRPVMLLPPQGARDSLVPVLVDVSRSMRLRDADGETRLARATAMLRTQLLPALARDFKTELYSVGETLEAAGIDALGADASRTDLTGALAAIRDRSRGQRVAGIILLSDGADTGQPQAGGRAASAGGPAVFAIGIGSADGVRDREVLGITAGDPRLDQSSVDLHVS